MIIVFLKSTTRPLESVNLPSSRICKKILKTFNNYGSLHSENNVYYVSIKQNISAGIYFMKIHYYDNIVIKKVVIQ